MKYLKYLLLICSISTLGAEDYSTYQDQLSPTQQKQAIQIEKQIMAACCFGGPVYSHGKNDITEKQKITIRKLLLEGKTEDEILDHFRNEIDHRTGEPYGNRILAAPKSDEAIGLVSYWMIAVFVLLGLGILVYVIRKLRMGASVSVPAKDPVSDETLEKIESELAELD